VSTHDTTSAHVTAQIIYLIWWKTLKPATNTEGGLKGNKLMHTLCKFHTHGKVIKFQTHAYFPWQSLRPFISKLLMCDLDGFLKPSHICTLCSTATGCRRLQYQWWWTAVLSLYILHNMSMKMCTMSKHYATLYFTLNWEYTYFQFSVLMVWIMIIKLLLQWWWWVVFMTVMLGLHQWLQHCIVRN